MDAIISQVETYLNNSLDHRVKKRGMGFSDVQILFDLGPSGEPRVFFCENKVRGQQVTFKEALNKKLDFLGIAGATELFVGKSLHAMAEKEKIPADKIAVMIDRNSAGDLTMYLFDGYMPQRQLEAEEIFNAELLQQ